MSSSRSSARMPIGYIRDRTAVYREKWDALHPNAAAERHNFGATDTTGLLSGEANGGATEVEMAPVQQSAVMEAEQRISAELVTARADLQQLSRLQAAAQEDLFGNDSSKGAAIEKQRARLRERIRTVHGLIVTLPAQADANTKAVAERIKRAKATALNDVAAELNRMEIQDLQAKAHKVPGMDANAMDAIFSELAAPTPAYTEQQLAQLSSLSTEYEQRDAAIAALVKEVTAIQEVMRDLSVLVVEQGSMVDRIDQNITAAAESVERGAEQVARAHEKSKSGAMATCIFVLLFAITVMFILMLVLKR